MQHSTDLELLAPFKAAVEPPGRRGFRSSHGLRSDLHARLRTHTLRWISATVGAGLVIIIALVAAITS